MKKLSQDELQTIVSFIQKRGFTYIDVQTEVLDHVACRVEDMISEDPELNLDAAIQKTHSEFGIFGFSTVEDGVISGLTKKYNRLFWRTFISFLSPRYIFLVLFAGYFLYKVLAIVDSKTCMYVLALGSVMTTLGYLYKSYRPEYNQYLAYRLSTAYFIGLGSMFSLMILIIDTAGSDFIYGIHPGYAIFAAFLVCFAMYVISAVQTSRRGMQASEEIRQKYQWITT